MSKSNEIKINFVTVPAHKFLYFKRYDSKGYWEFWENQDKNPDLDCHIIEALFDGVSVKLDGENGITGKASGQLMARINEVGRTAEAYGVRVPINYNKKIHAEVCEMDVPETEYLVFEYDGSFNYENETESIEKKLQATIDAYDFNSTDYALDHSINKITYFYFDPEKYLKRLIPVKRK